MTAIQQALIRKAQRSLRAAERLLEGDDPDFAVSRAYYCMFYVAQAFLATKQLSFRKHSAVVASFGEQFAATDSVPREFHRFLIEAQNARNSGDYLTESSITAEDAREHIGRARKFLELADSYLGGMS